ncbi:MAG: SDR family oxidoreductase, partial [Candidatus Thermoplasmatota archaeon]|nr:SDR family oxidoreductase [Candidatus Thermoplasmatota archaeon]
YEEGLEGWTEDIPMNRLGKPMELGELVAFLSSPRSSFINGAAIPIDGGGSNSNL